MLSLSPMGEIIGQESLSWNWALLPWSDVVKEKLVFLSSLLHQILDFCCCSCSNTVPELLCYTPRLPQRHFHLWVIVKLSVLWGKEGRKVLFCHFDDITPLFSYWYFVWMFYPLLKMGIKIHCCGFQLSMFASYVWRFWYWVHIYL